MAGSNVQVRLAHSPVLRYCLAVASIGTALGLALVSHRFNFHNVEVPLFLFAVAISAWYAGSGPAAVAVALAILLFDYFFTEPRYTFYVTAGDLPYFAVFAGFALLVAWFSAVRRRVERELRQASNRLEAEVAERTRQAGLLDQLNQELKRRSGELEAANKELESFAYSVSHDLRAPLRHMAGYSELLQKRASSSLDEKSNRYISMILDSAKRMGNLIDDLLTFSRIGRAETQKTLISLTQIVKEALSEVRQETEGRNILWKISALPDFYADRSMLRLVLVNLLSNAIKFTRMRPQAQIEIGCTDGNGENLIVYVRDNGVGFDMKYANKLFGVFQRLHQSEAFEGTGIGLATVQRIIHRHGGRVWAEGAVDEGAAFYFSVPNPQGQPWTQTTN